MELVENESIAKKSKLLANSITEPVRDQESKYAQLKAKKLIKAFTVTEQSGEFLQCYMNLW